jgi:hypothetical protein
MKLSQLLEDLPTYIPAGKEKLLRTIFTPDNLKDHYELILMLVAKACSLDDLQDLHAKIHDTAPSVEDEAFHLKLIMKALPAEANAKIVAAKDNTNGADTIQGKLPPTVKNKWISANERQIEEVPMYFNAFYQKGKWCLYAMNDRYTTHDWKKTKFDGPKDLLKELLKEFPKRDKYREELRAAFTKQNAQP